MTEAPIVEVDLFGGEHPVIRHPAIPGRTIQERFEKFHELNPWVYNTLVSMAREMIAAGHRRHIGMKMLFEVLRWNFYKQSTDPNAEIGLSNDFHARYSRLIMEQEEDLRGVFELRELRTD